jgi:hypothetical protein
MGSRVETRRRDAAGEVAQICNLLYRRVALGWAFDFSKTVGLFDGSQNAILRYGLVTNSRDSFLRILPLSFFVGPGIPHINELRSKS